MAPRKLLYHRVTNAWDEHVKLEDGTPFVVDGEDLEVMAEDLARADGVTLETYVCPNGDTHYTDKGQDAFEEFVTQAEQLMTDSGLTKGEY